MSGDHTYVVQVMERNRSKLHLKQHVDKSGSNSPQPINVLHFDLNRHKSEHAAANKLSAGNREQVNGLFARRRKLPWIGQVTMKFRLFVALLVLCMGSVAAAQTPGPRSSTTAGGQDNHHVAGRPAGDGTTVRLAWDPSPNKSVVGYRVHYGTESGKYTHQIHVDGRLNAVADVRHLKKGKAYFFAVTSVDADGHESRFSNEVTNNPAKPYPARKHTAREVAPKTRPPQPDSGDKIPPKFVRTSPEGKILPSR